MDVEMDTEVSREDNTEKLSDVIVELKILIDKFESGRLSDVEKIDSLLSNFQLQPELLDPHLEALVPPLMNLVRENISSIPDATKLSDESFVVNRCFKVIYVLCKVRKYKTIVKFFPHEVSDFEPTLEYLLAQDRNWHSSWETRYGLMLWLSMMVLIPFDLTTIDSNVGQSGKAGIIDRLISVGQDFLTDSGKTREAAAIMLGKLFSRHDVQGQSIQTFLKWSIDVLVTQSDVLLAMGVFHALAEVFKSAPRESVVEYAPEVFTRVSDVCESSSNLLLRRFSVKLSQRIGLAFLKPRLAPWRYQRGNRCLLGSKSDGTTSEQKESGAEAMEEEVEVPEQIEQIIEQLLSGLRDESTVVRWSAAKGIGRVTMRLPAEFADEVVREVLELFSPHEGDKAWHGGCLCLAELARRGLLLPTHLEKVVPIVLKALLYDVIKGAHSIGAHVRDAACYVAWAFARAYAPTVLEPHVAVLARGLLVVGAFDREVNCRRAACASFQENVGRQGNFPHGIEINTTADYFTVGNRINSYTKIAPAIAKFEDYQIHMIDHIVDVKLVHWDKSIRELAADALYNLAGLNPEYITGTVLPTLIARTLSPTVTERHGATLGVARAVVGLAEAGARLDDDLQKKVRNIVIKVEKARLFRGKGGQFMRAACCGLIEAIARANLPLGARTVLRLQESLDENVKHPMDEINSAAISALRQFSRRYHTVIADKCQDRIVSRFIKSVSTDQNPAVTRGFSLALGVLPKEILLPQLGLIVSTLVAATRIQDDPDERDPETRRNAVRALTELTLTVGAADCAATTLDPSTQRLRGDVTCLVPETTHRRSEQDGERPSVTADGAMQVDPLSEHTLGDVSDHPVAMDIDDSEKATGSVKVVTDSDMGTTASDKMTNDSEMMTTASDKMTTDSEMMTTHIDKTTTDIDKTTTDSEMATTDSGTVLVLTVLDVVCIALQRNSRDYSTENRGDVGSWVRQAAVEGLEPVLLMVSTDFTGGKVPNRRFNLEFGANVVRIFLKQTMERINSLRECAGARLESVLSSTGPEIPGIPNRLELAEALGGEPGINWSSTSDVFPRVVPLMKLEPFRFAIFSGLVMCVGGVTGSLVRDSSSALLQLFCDLSEDEKDGDRIIEMIAADVLLMIRDNPHHPRLSVPILKTTAFLLSNSCFENLGAERSTFGAVLLKLVKAECRSCKDVVKSLAACDVYIGLIPYGGEVRSGAFQALLSMLGYPYPKVRSVTAERLYSQLLTFDDIFPEDKMDEILEILVETSWTSRVSEVRPVRDRLYDLIGLKKPEKSRKSNEKRKVVDVSVSEEPSYREFVNDLKLGYT
eukprot:258519_1